MGDMEAHKTTRFGSQQRERYARQLLLDNVGVAGQRRLAQARVAVVGVGGLGANAAMYLAAAGVGTLDLIDLDPLERSNLHRQVLYREPQLGMSKVAAAKAQLAALNPEVAVHSHECRLDSHNALSVLSKANLLIDGSDNFETRHVINQSCGELGIPWVYGAAEAMEGQLSVFWPNAQPGQWACYHCLFPEETQGDNGGCHRRGVLGPVPGFIAQLQVIEAIKLIVGFGELLKNRLLTVNMANSEFQKFRFPADPGCHCANWEASPSLNERYLPQ
jgi:molybdopterin/thiamine biosynthesis adenylyltransferase